MEKEVVYQVPPEGSLGLLALGHIGLLAWRKARKAYEEKTGERFQNFYYAEISNDTTAEKEPVKPRHES